ncbi:sensor domain-containing protein [Uliginosibacterium sp. H1]|uniref:sensor domain-containing protein n=1 Tax=Uliginosibacterium sp. H1 TaxID=3114757 RepID=UPI002E1782D6|nr:EAL domain-containing protein [Uliginosibacterium sp. H1]
MTIPRTLLNATLSATRSVLLLCDDDWRIVESFTPSIEDVFDRAVPGTRLPESMEARLRASPETDVEVVLDGARGPQWYQVTRLPPDPSARPAHQHVLMVRDITRQKRQELSLVNDAEFSQRLIDSLPGLVFLFRPDGQLLLWNAGLEEATGYRREEIAQYSVLDYFHDQARETVREQIDHVLRHGQGQNEGLLRHRGGSLQPVYFRTRLFAYRGQTCLLGVGTDMSPFKEAAARLEESERRFRAIFEQIPNIAVQGYNRQREVIYWNPASHALYGYRREEALGRKLEDLIIPEPMREDVVRFITGWTNGGPAIPASELDLQRKDGSVAPVFSSHVMIRNTRNELEMYCLDVDLSELRRTQRQLHLTDTMFRDIRAGIMITDPDNRIITLNPAFTDILGYGVEEVAGEDPRIFASGRHDDAFFHGMWQTLQSEGIWQGEIWNRHRNGESVPLWMSISAVREGAAPASHYIAIFTDISPRSDAQPGLHALHDSLTGLPSRALASDRLERSLAHGEHSLAALMLLDLDRFAEVNQRLGHVFGDRLLQAAVARIQDCIGHAATLSRRDGDAFVLVLPDLRHHNEVSAIAESILGRMAEPISIDEHILISSFSIGVALYPEDGRDFDELLASADTALRRAKDAGRNTYRFLADSMNADARERLSLQNELRAGMRRGELVLHFQPQIDMISGLIVGAEALVRWDSPEHGLVSPARLIPAAEESGLIIPLGEWVLREACRQAQEWRAQGLPDLTVAVNMSAVQFQHSDPVDTVTRVLIETGLPAGCLELELTESMLAEDSGQLLASLHRLKALGLQLAIDDFGTGHSNLAYLKKFPIDKLKIDQSFVRDIGTDADDSAVLRAVIQLGSSLQLSTIAEGVETATQLEYLRSHGCSQVQGYLMGRPMTAEAFATLMRESLGVLKATA